MKSLYGMYIAEREGRDIVESDKGFAIYQILGEGKCYLQEVYVLPNYRRQGLSKYMTDEVVEIAKNKECHTLLVSVCTNDKNVTTNIKVWLNYGFKIDKLIGTLIFLKKDITGVE